MLFIQPDLHRQLSNKQAISTASENQQVNCLYVTTMLPSGYTLIVRRHNQVTHTFLQQNKNL